MRALLFKLAVIASVALCGGATVMCGRSYSHLTALVVVRTVTHLYGVSVLRGGVYVVRTEAPANAQGQRRIINTPLRGDVEYMTVPHQFGGFGYMRPSEGFSAFRMPAWLLIVLPAAFVTAVGWRGMRRVRRRSAGRCATCGYDLRGTPDRCPECGAVPADAPGAAAAA